MNPQQGPRLAIILVTPDRYAVIRRTVRSLRRQTIREAIELILVAPSLAQLDLEESDLEGFHSHRLVEVGHGRTAGETRVAGMEQATAPIVSYLEDHAFPADDQWAELLLQTHQQPWGAVAPLLVNGNPASLISWASYLLCFGIWACPAPPGGFASLPWRNTSYRRTVLLEVGPELADLFVAEVELHENLVRRGYRLYLDPEARLLHLNFNHLRPMLHEQYTVGRVIGASRARRWSRSRRLLYLVGGPLIPLARLLRMAPGWRVLLRERRLMPQIVPPLAAGLLAGSTGEWIGYLCGPGLSADTELTKVEVNPDRHLVAV